MVVLHLVGAVIIAEKKATSVENVPNHDKVDHNRVIHARSAMRWATGQAIVRNKVAIQVQWLGLLVLLVSYCYSKDNSPFLRFNVNLTPERYTLTRK